MSKRWTVLIAGTTLGVLALAALPGRSQASQSKASGGSEWNLNCEISRLRQEAARLVAEAARIREVEWPAQLARLSARRAELSAALRAQTAELRERAAERAQALADDLAESRVAGSVFADSDGEAGWLGVAIAEVTADKAKELKLPAVRGVLLTAVEAESPAAKAGLKTSDVVTEFNGQRVEGTAQFRRLGCETPRGRA